MRSILLDLSGKMDSSHRGALSLIKGIADSLAIHFFVVGASARDYVLENGTVLIIKIEPSPITPVILLIVIH